MEDYNPRPYQDRMTDFVINHDRCGLFAEMGLGKTVTTLTAIKELMYYEFKVDRVLIIAPLRVALLTWPDEIEKWNHTRTLTYSVVYGDDRLESLSANTDIHIISYSTLTWLVDYLRKHKRLPYDYDMVIFDESTYIKTKSSQRWTICNALFYDTPRKVILTGTPSPNGLHDVWGQIFHLDHGRALGASLSEFRRRYFMREGYKYFPLRNAKHQISKKLADLVMPMKAEDYLSLPPFITNKVRCRFDTGQQRLYDQLEQQFFVDIAGIETSAFDAAALSTKLRQYVQGFLYNDEEGVSWVHDLKLQALKDIIDNTDDNVFVAVQFKQDIALIKKYFGDVPCIYSGTNVKDDMVNIGKWNRKELPMLVAHPGSLAHGVNLQHGGHTVIWYGQTWSLEHHDQFNARIYRQGQTTRVIAHYILIAGTIDEVIMQVINRKTKTQYELMRDIQTYRKQKTGG